MLVSWVVFSCLRLRLTRVDTEHGVGGKLKAIFVRILEVFPEGRWRSVAEAVDAACQQASELAEAVLGTEIGAVTGDGHGRLQQEEGWPHH
jgi:hypothetical protein